MSRLFNLWPKSTKLLSCATSAAIPVGGAKLLQPVRFQHQITAAQAWNALQPLYVSAQDPKIFDKYPEFLRTNERSLQMLHGYLDAMFRRRVPHQPPTYMTFYLRTSAERTPFLVVELDISQYKDPYSVVKTVLEHCSLPTCSLPGCENARKRNNQNSKEPNEELLTTYDEEQIKAFWAKKIKDVRLQQNCLGDWIEKLSPKALKTRDQHDTLRRELQNEVDWLCERTGLSQITSETDLRLSLYKASLLALRRVLDGNVQEKELLRNVRIKLKCAPGSYVSVGGQLILGAQDVPLKWAQLILSSPNNPTLQRVMEELPIALEKLSQVLGGANIAAISDSPLLPYMRWVETALAALNNGQSSKERVSFPNDLSVVLHGENASLSLGTAGEVHLPCNCSPQKLNTFLTENVNFCRSLGAARADLQSRVVVAKRSAIKLCGLTALSWDDTVRLEAVLECVERLHWADGNLRNQLCGHSLHISVKSEFGVRSDGRIIVPLTWQL